MITTYFINQRYTRKRNTKSDPPPPQPPFDKLVNVNRKHKFESKSHFELGEQYAKQNHQSLLEWKLDWHWHQKCVPPTPPNIPRAVQSVVPVESQWIFRWQQQWQRLFFPSFEWNIEIFWSDKWRRGGPYLASDEQESRVGPNVHANEQTGGNSTQNYA